MGVTLPGVVRNNRLELAVNLDPRWAVIDPIALFRAAVGGYPVALLNDANAAGIAEVHHGAGQDVSGTVLVLTFGTGVGSALLVDGELVPNMEVGQLPYAGGVWQDVISARARINADVSWERWAELTDEFLRIVEDVLWPDLIIIGGGILEERPGLLELLSTRADCVVARHGADAGVIGAAMAAQDVINHEESRVT